MAERRTVDPDAEERWHETGEWDDPVPLDAARAPVRFPVDALPDAMAVFVGCVASATQVPADLPGVLVLEALAAAAGGRVVVEPRAGWVEPTNLYAAVALPPGNRKSAVFQIVTAPLRVAEKKAIESVEAIIGELIVEKTVAEQKATDAKRAASRAEDAADATLDSDSAGKFKKSAKQTDVGRGHADGYSTVGDARRPEPGRGCGRTSGAWF